MIPLLFLPQSLMHRAATPLCVRPAARIVRYRPPTTTETILALIAAHVLQSLAQFSLSEFDQQLPATRKKHSSKAERLL
jgi:hypothetical protein